MSAKIKFGTKQHLMPIKYESAPVQNIPIGVPAKITISKGL